MTLHHPPSTLFPYTTLFRSTASFKLDPRIHHSIQQIAGEVHHDVRQGDDQDGGLHLWVIARADRLDQQPAQPGPGEDQKSTRLNSSHTVISYAVFCLKKKKQ